MARLSDGGRFDVVFTVALGVVFVAGDLLKWRPLRKPIVDNYLYDNKSTEVKRCSNLTIDVATDGNNNCRASENVKVAESQEQSMDEEGERCEG